MTPWARWLVITPLVAGACGTSCAVRHAGSPQDDLVAISHLHEQDVEATLSGDPAALAQLWADDAVRLEPGGPAEQGKAAITADDRQQRAAAGQATVLQYTPRIESIQVFGDRAVEWGYFETVYRRTSTDTPHTIHGKLLRVLERQRDGSWRFSHVMWNAAD
jgi:uncharacterized protein (TIGR02246 family)